MLSAQRRQSFRCLSPDESPLATGKPKLTLVRFFPEKIFFEHTFVSFLFVESLGFHGEIFKWRRADTVPWGNIVLAISPSHRV